MPYFVRAQRNGKVVRLPMGNEPLDNAFKSKGHLIRHGWTRVNVIDETGRVIRPTKEQQALIDTAASVNA